LKKIIIIGGGLAGLITAIKLIDAGISSLVVEKKSYPFHRVCGEYISNEATPFLQSIGLFPDQFVPTRITHLELSAIRGDLVRLPLDLGGFGISRFTFDHFLYQEASKRGVKFLLNTEIVQVSYAEGNFTLKTSQDEILNADLVIGAYGKRSRLDISMNRSFTRKRSPFVGVKYHIKTSHPADLIALHNFRGGYCGVSNVEDGKTNLCYLTERDQLKKHKNIVQFQEAVMFQNPHLKKIFQEADFLFKSPETINEITFETKSAVEGHVLMTGDSAGMITPLCGNGMAIAIHSAKILSELIIRFCNDKAFTHAQLEFAYADAWKNNFSRRLWKGRQVQKLFGQRWASSFAVHLARFSKPIADEIVRNTHGPVF
jgi:flavin-dependent dehydrogenase